RFLVGRERELRGYDLELIVDIVLVDLLTETNQTDRNRRRAGCPENPDVSGQRLESGVALDNSNHGISRSLEQDGTADRGLVREELASEPVADDGVRVSIVARQERPSLAWCRAEKIEEVRAD